MRIAYQGVTGAYSYLAAREHSPHLSAEGLKDFGAVVSSVIEGRSELGMLPVSNSIVGSVPGISDLLSEFPELVEVDRLHQRIAHTLLALPGADLPSIRWAESHPVALAQCSKWLSARGLSPRSVDDTAGAARAIAHDRDWTRAAIAHESVAEHHGLEVIARDIADTPDNITTFVVVARRAGKGKVAA